MIHKQTRVMGLTRIEGENGENISKIIPSYLMKNEEKKYKKMKKKCRTYNHPSKLYRTQHMLQGNLAKVEGNSRRKDEDLSKLSTQEMNQHRKSFKKKYSNHGREKNVVKDLSLNKERKKSKSLKLSGLFTKSSSKDSIIDPNNNVSNISHVFMDEESFLISMENLNFCGIHPSVGNNQRVKKSFINEVREEVSGSIIDLVTTVDQIWNAFVIDDDDIDKCVNNIQKASHDLYTIQSTENLCF